MHLQVEGDMRQGLQMMKYSINHSYAFCNPWYAYFVALMQCIGGICAEVSCIAFLCSLNNPIEVIIRFVAFASIGKVDNFYAAALPSENKIKRDSDPMKIVKHRRDFEKKENKAMSFFITRFIYKGMRILYTSCIFYYLPYLALFLPQFADSVNPYVVSSSA